VLHSVPDLVNAIDAYLKANNDNPEPFLWTATADEILAKQALDRPALQREAHRRRWPLPEPARKGDRAQALDRTQPSLPMKKGRAGTMTHDYKRNGTTTLFAALSTLDGSVVGQCLPRHRHQEFLKFLRQLDRAFPSELDLHLIVDNYRTHKHDNVNAWLAKHPRFHLHFTPTASSWLNLVERWFRELTEKAIRRGVFHSVPDLISAIDAFLAAHNQDPKPFVWTASIDSILAKIGRCKAILETVH
jgi:transposase